MLSGWQAAAAIAVMAAVTFLLRFLPFVAAGLLRRHRIIRALGRFLPATILMLLLINTLMGFIRQDSSTPAGIWPSLIAMLLTLGIHLWCRQALVSIVAGTGAYVLMRNAPWLF